MDEGLFVAVITFPQGISKPYVLRQSGREEIFIRVGSTSQLATREQQMRLFLLGGMLHTELLPVQGTSFECLDFVRLENYLKDIVMDPDVPDTSEDWVSRLLGLGFMTDVSGDKYCTIAGLRVFGFDSEDKEYKALFDEILVATLVGRWEIKKSERTLIDSETIERFMALIKPFISEESNSIDENFRRDRNWFYPVEAVREVFITALAHRDWTKFVEL